MAYSSDMWPRHQIWKMGGQPMRHPPDVVVWPGSEAEVAAVVRACSKYSVPIVPYGAGSGVCGGAVPIRGGVVVDMKRLNRFIEVDDHDLTVTAGPGIIGMHLEEELDARGYTLGHFPSSIVCSTLGGWLAARSAGQFSSRYGKIEDMIVSMRVVLADGSILETGPDQPFDWTQVIVGSEGILGLITQATLRMHPKPESAAFRGYRFRNLEDAVRAVRLVMQAGLAPHVIRLYDPFDSLLHSSGGGQVSSMLDPIRDVLGGRVGAFGKRASKKVGIAVALSVPAVLNKVVDSISASCLLIVGFEGHRRRVDEDM
ncbi:MAG: alkyldihydroxyacetonephosphate synthase, partial [Myxococcota bacterium]